MFRFLTASVAALALAGTPLAAHADGFHRDHDGYGHGYDRGYGYGYGDHHRDDDAGTAIAVGVGIIGLVALASALSHQNKQAPVEHYPVEHYPADTNGGSGGWYNPDTQAQSGYPAPAYPSGPRYATNDRFSDGNSFDPSSCRQTREYQTKVTIGGRTENAYGTACLQADGTWLRGPLRVDR